MTVNLIDLREDIAGVLDDHNPDPTAAWWARTTQELLDQLDHAEARLHAVQRLVDQATDNHARTIPIHRIRRILDTPWQGSTTAPCGRGPCCLGSGHDGDCRQ